MKVWYHVRCMFETLQRARATTKKIETPADLEGFGDLKDSEKDEIKQSIKGNTLHVHVHTYTSNQILLLNLLPNRRKNRHQLQHKRRRLN